MGLNSIKVNNTQITAVDSLPTAASENLISSEAILNYNDLSGARASLELGCVLYELVGWLEPSLKKCSGRNSNFHSTGFIPVQPTEKLVISGGFQSKGYYILWAYETINSDPQFYLPTTQVYVNYDFTIPEGIHYIRLTSETGSYVTNCRLLRPLISLETTGELIKNIYLHHGLNTTVANVSQTQLIPDYSVFDGICRRRYAYNDAYYGISGNIFYFQGNLIYYLRNASVQDIGWYYENMCRTIDITDSNNWTSTTKFDGNSDINAIIYSDNHGSNNILKICEMFEFEYINNGDTKSGVVQICSCIFRADGKHIILQEFLRNKTTLANSIIVVNKMADEILISNAQTFTTGVIQENGSIGEPSAFYHVDPIEIPDGIKYIKFAYGINIPNYVACYTNDDFTGFLGFSDGHSFYDLTLKRDNIEKILELRSGTKYISYYGYRYGSPYTVGLGLNMVIIGGTAKTGDQKLQINYTANRGSDETECVSFNLNSSNSIFSGEPDTTEHFSYYVNCNITMQTDSDTVTLQDSSNLYRDYGAIMLPSNYSRSGTPVPLVIACHGAGGTVDASSSQIERNIVAQYLVANGYSVCDCNGLPAEWILQYGIQYSDRNNIGSPIAMESYNKLYQYVITHYNVMHDVLVWGGSMGGISSTNLVMSKSIPVIAHGISCPVLDAYNQVFLHPWSGGVPKQVMGIIYNLDKDSSNNLIYNEEKVKGYNPMVLGMQSYDSTGKRVSSVGLYNFTNKTLNGQTVTEYKSYPCPLKIWHCKDDPTVAYACSERHVNAIRNAGGNAILRSIITGGHGPEDIGEYLDNPIGNVNYRGTTLQIKPIVEEMFMFYERYTKR